ncbi:MAG: WD40 repeat domain-containing serine/threonine protein kinase [Limisphaerales bacterium]
MKIPVEAQWCRVEELARDLSGLEPDRAAARLAELAAAGETRTVLSLLGAWHTLPPPAPGLGPGSVIDGNYTLHEKIGEGGMGTVWRATQRTIEREVALKIIHPFLVSPSLRNYAVDEIRTLGQLNHPGIVRIFHAGFHDDPRHGNIPYFAMELVDGIPLGRWAREHPHRHDRGRVLEIVAAVCSSIQAAHDRHILHRDLKPANILVREDGPPVVLDFGIARLVGTPDGDEPTAFSGTPQYAAPEQHLGRDLDFRSGESVDVYALGAILFELLAGRRLFEFPHGTSITEMRRAVLEDPVPRLASLIPDCPPDLDELVARAVRRDPADRYFSVAALGRAISRVAAQLSPREMPPARWVPEADATVPGTRWRLVERLGEGGAGEVWLGSHEDLPDPLVFKFCSTEERARTLKREFTLFRLLKERIGQNPHFIRLHEVSLDEPPWYLMMDYVDAQSLDAWCESRPGGLQAIPLGIRIEIVAQVAEALQAAHEAGILHRDIKPSNLLVRNPPRDRTSITPADVHVFVADFGIGQIILDHLHVGDVRGGFTRTVSGQLRSEVSGTMLYLAPEVLEGGPATARSDIHSLGVVFWQLLVGDLNAALDAADWTSRIPDPLLREDLHRCLARSSDKRWASAGEFAASLRALEVRATAEARRLADLANLERAAYRRGVIRTSLVAAGIIGLLAVLGTYALIKDREASRARANARSETMRSELSSLAALAGSPAPNRHRSADEIVRRSRPETDAERRERVDAYAAVLETDDWSVPASNSSLTPATTTDHRALAAQLDATSRFLARLLPGQQLELVDTLNSTAHWRIPLESDDSTVLALSPGAQLVAVASGNRLRILKGAVDGAGAEAGPWTWMLPDPARIQALAWDPRGTTLAVGISADEDDDGGFIELRTAPDWNVSHRLNSDSDSEHPRSRPPAGLAFSPDGRWLAHWSFHSLHLLVWEVVTRRIAAYAYHPAPVRTALWASPTHLYSAAENAYLYRWEVNPAWGDALPMDLPTARYPALGAALSGHPTPWSQMAPLIGGTHLAAVDASSEVSVIDLATGQIRISLPSDSPILATGVRNQHRQIVTHHADGSQRPIQFVRSPIRYSVISPQLGDIEDFDLHPDGTFLACCGIGGVVVFNADRREFSAPETTAQSRGIRFLADGRLVVSSRFGDSVIQWNEDSLVCAPPPPSTAFVERNSENSPARLVADAAGRHVVSARARALVWADLESTTGGESRRIDFPEDSPPEHPAISPDGTVFGWTDARRAVWIASGSPDTERRLPWTGTRLVFLGNDLGAVFSESGVLVFDVDDGTHVAIDGLDPTGITELVADTRGPLAATARREGGIELARWRSTGGLRWEPFVRLGKTESGTFSRLRFLADGRWLGAIASNGRLHIWNVAELLRILAGSNGLPPWAMEDPAIFPVPVPRSSTP